MANLILRHVPEDLLKRLKARAAAHGRALPDEILAILGAAAPLGAVDATALAEKVRKVFASSLARANPRPTPASAPAAVDPEATAIERRPSTTNPTEVVRRRQER